MIQLNLHVVLKVYFDVSTFVLLLMHKCRTFTCNIVFLHCDITTFTEVNDVNTNTYKKHSAYSGIIFRLLQFNQWWGEFY